jgi:hypothetical protein
MASLIRPRSLKRLSCQDESLRARILHGSDYPLPPSRLPYLLRTGLFPGERHNPLDLDLRIKRSFSLGSGYEHRIAELLGLPGARTTEVMTAGDPQPPVRS